MAITTYTELKTAIESWLDRDDLADKTDDFIAIAESRHRRKVRIREMISRCTIGVTSRYVALPTDFLEGKTFRLLTTPIVYLNQVNMDHLDRVRRETAGTPAYFTVNSEIELDRPPDQSYTGEMIYYKELRGLGSSNSTNALLSRAPDVYLYSCLAAAAPWLSDDERIPLWEGLYKAAVGEINTLDQRGIGVPVATVPGVRP